MRVMVPRSVLAATLIHIIVAIAVYAPSLLLGVEAQSHAQSNPDAAHEDFPGQLPASFSGEPNCSTCAGVRQNVELRPQNVFVRRLIYPSFGEFQRRLSRALGAPAGSAAETVATFDDVGRWEISGDRKLLTLRGARFGSMRFAIKDARTLLAPDLAHGSVDSVGQYVLMRAEAVPPIEPKLSLAGMYSAVDGAGVLVECTTGLRLPIAPEKAGAQGINAALTAEWKPGESLLVGLVGRIMTHSSARGASTEPLLVPVRITHLLSGGTCETASRVIAASRLARSVAGQVAVGLWTLLDHDLGVPTPEDTTRIKLVFTGLSGGQLEVATGCNTRSARYVTNGDALVTTDVATTGRLCPGSMASWEEAFFRFLESGPTFQLEGYNLAIVSPHGDKRVWFLPERSPNAVRKKVHVSAELKACGGLVSADCLQVRESESEPWQVFHGDFVGFKHTRGVEAQVMIFEDPVRGGAGERWYLDHYVSERVVKP